MTAVTRRWSRGTVAAALVLASACHGKPKLELKDTESRVFRADCDNDGNCVLKQKSGPPAPSGKPALVVRSPGTLVGVCTVATPTDKPARADCRALVCKQDADCPPAHGLPHGSCVGSHCTEPAHPLGVDDAVMLCLAGTGLGRSTPEQVARYAMALNCGTPCKVPTPCARP